jgi:excisionase family DNA binding protein
LGCPNVTGMADDERDAYSVEEVAKRLGISVRHCYQMIRKGKLPAIKLGHRLLVPKEQLEAFLRGEWPDPNPG